MSLPELAPKAESRKAQVAARVAGAFIAIASAGTGSFESIAQAESDITHDSLIRETEVHIMTMTNQMQQMVENGAPNASSKLIPIGGQNAKRLMVWLKDGSSTNGNPKYDQVIAYIAPGDKLPFLMAEMTGADRPKYSPTETVQASEVLIRKTDKPRTYQLKNKFRDAAGKLKTITYKLPQPPMSISASNSRQGFDNFTSKVENIIQEAGSGLPTA